MTVDDGKQELREKWEALLKNLFEGSIPDSAVWSGASEIAHVLNAISSSVNHAFYPDGGGHDLFGAQITSEGNLEWSIHEDGLKTFANVARPIKLTFWNPGKQNHEANFVLEVGGLEPLGLSQYQREYFEELTEICPGTYEPLSSWEYGRTQSGDQLPSDARRLCRVIKSARFAIFGKGSIYNSYRGNGFDAYDARHNDPVQFKKIVEKMAEVEI